MRRMKARLEPASSPYGKRPGVAVDLVLTSNRGHAGEMKFDARASTRAQHNFRPLHRAPGRWPDDHGRITDTACRRHRIDRKSGVARHGLARLATTAVLPIDRDNRTISATPGTDHAAEILFRRGICRRILTEGRGPKSIIISHDRIMTRALSRLRESMPLLRPFTAHA